MKKNVAIIGAGVAGLSCGQALRATGCEVTVFEKSRSLGGRCATRRWNGHVVDHGVQFFTAQNPIFQEAVQAAAGSHLHHLTQPVTDLEGQILLPDGPARWCHAAGNNRLGQAWAQGLTVRLESPVAQVLPKQGEWEIHGERFAAVVSCAPWPQSAAIFGMETRGRSYHPNLTGFFSYRGDWAGLSTERYAVRDEGGKSPLAWSACENHKPGRITDGVTVFVVQTSAAFSQEFLEQEPAVWLAALQPALEQLWELVPENRLETWGHRWRYAFADEAASPHGHLPPGCFITGDSLVASRLEEVWLHGQKTAQEVGQALG